VLDGGNDEPLIAANRLTVPGFLHRQGYATACIGKWHLGFQSDARPKAAGGKKGMGSGGLPLGSRIIGGPTTRGFDYFWGCSNARTMSSLIENERVVEILEPIQMLPRLTQQAVDYLGAQAAAARTGKPFFLYVPLTSPHTPIVPSPEWQGKSPLGAYGDFVMQTDAAVGRLLTALQEHGLATNTLVVFTSDNGCSPQAGTSHLEQLGHFASAQYRGYKADIREGGHRIPFLVRWPGHVQPGSVNATTICLTDLIATLAEVTGTPLPESAGQDSVSFLPALRGLPIPHRRAAIVHHSINGQFSIREGRWKLNFCAGSGGWSKPGDPEARKLGLPPAQLYDLDLDPAEKTNLISAQPDQAARLTALLSDYIARGRSTPGQADRNDVPVKAPSAFGTAR